MKGIFGMGMCGSALNGIFWNSEERRAGAWLSYDLAAHRNFDFS
jgi:hypothetical protein